MTLAPGTSSVPETAPVLRSPSAPHGSPTTQRAWRRRIVKKVITTWVILPIYRDKGYARLARAASVALGGSQRKAWLGMSAVIVAISLAAAGHNVPAVLIALLVFGTGLVAAAGVAQRKRLVKHIARASWSNKGSVPARDALLALGIAEERVDAVISAARQGEVRIAAFDQNNQVLSDVGPIPFFTTVSSEPQDFRRRARHVVELVIARDVVCVKKSYGDRPSFEREVLALNALSGLPGVPRLLAVRYRQAVVYQSFIRGHNLGSVMTRHGASVSCQYQVSVSFDRPGRWDPDSMAEARDVAVRALRASSDSSLIGRAAELMDQIHQRGVTLSDVKYGNILVADGDPCFCDFEWATVHRRNNWRFMKSRDNDREKFNYFFDGSVLSERAFHTAVSRLADQNPDLFYAPIYYGHGYESRTVGSIELGSGKWHFIRRHLPDLQGKSIVDLGCNNGLLPLEMLRAGARRVTAYELNPTVARYARLNHRWFEVVDNARYPGFQLIEGYMHEACERDWSGYDIATAFCSLYYETPDQMARIVRSFSRTIECLVVQANENPKEHEGVLLERSSLPFLRSLLSANGYRNQTVIRFSYYDRPLIIARRSLPMDRPVSAHAYQFEATPSASAIEQRARMGRVAP